MSNNNKTIYEVTVTHDNRGRSVIIVELLDGLFDGRRAEVANFVCINSDEYDWLKRNGKSPWFAYRYHTIVKNDEEDSDTTHWPPGSYSITEHDCDVRSDEAVAS